MHLWVLIGGYGRLTTVTTVLLQMCTILVTTVHNNNCFDIININLYSSSIIS